MYFALEMPPVHRLYGTPISAKERWKGWGWCDAPRMATLINETYRVNWTPYDLIQRFGLPEEVARLTRKFGLRLLEEISTNPFLRLRSYDQSVLVEISRTKPRFFVPAGWAKQVMGALHQDGRRLEIKEGKVVVCSENGDGIYFL